MCSCVPQWPWLLLRERLLGWLRVFSAFVKGLLPNIKAGKTVTSAPLHQPIYSNWAIVWLCCCCRQHTWVSLSRYLLNNRHPDWLNAKFWGMWFTWLAVPLSQPRWYHSGVMSPAHNVGKEHNKTYKTFIRMLDTALNFFNNLVCGHFGVYCLSLLKNSLSDMFCVLHLGSYYIHSSCLLGSLLFYCRQVPAQIPD